MLIAGGRLAAVVGALIADAGGGCDRSVTERGWARHGEAKAWAPALAPLPGILVAGLLLSLPTLRMAGGDFLSMAVTGSAALLLAVALLVAGRAALRLSKEGAGAAPLNAGTLALT